MKKNDNSGAIFPVKERASDKHPNLSGNVDVGGKEWFVVGWTNTYEDTDGNTKKYISLKFNEPKPKDETSKVVGKVNSPFSNDDVPF